MSCCLCCLNKTSTTSSVKKNAGPLSSSSEPPDSVELQTGLSVRDRTYIKDTETIIYDHLHLEEKGVDFLITFFEKYPHRQRYFKAFKNVPLSELKSLPKMANHGRRVMDQMASIIHHIEDPDTMKEYITKLQDSHAPRNVSSNEFKDMLTVFMDYIKKHMGPRYSSRHEEAWEKLKAYFLKMADEAYYTPGNALSTNVSEMCTIQESGTAVDVDANVNQNRIAEDFHQNQLEDVRSSAQETMVDEAGKNKINQNLNTIDSKPNEYSKDTENCVRDSGHDEMVELTKTDTETNTKTVHINFQIPDGASDEVLTSQGIGSENGTLHLSEDVGCEAPGDGSAHPTLDKNGDHDEGRTGALTEETQDFVNEEKKVERTDIVADTTVVSKLKADVNSNKKGVGMENEEQSLVNGALEKSSNDIDNKISN